ncbi:MAG: hypothetical protein HZB57_03100 [Gammaproteobacteria bacterium]|nr:hypothetical protein [Gammaproteobacteria bacterium]
MMKAIVRLAALLCSAHAYATWEFSAPLDVSPDHAPNVFQHLDASGRRNIAVNRDAVAVVWEDNHAGQPDAYIALKRLADKTFSTPQRVSAGAEAFAPGVAAFGAGFLAGWTEGDTVWVRYVDGNGIGQPVRLSTRTADQLALAPLDLQTALAVWMETRADGTCIHAARLAFVGNSVTAGRAFPVSDCASQRFQARPALATGPKGILVVWQDRSTGINRVYVSVAADARHFSPPVQINDTIEKSATYGSGSSAIDPVVAQSAAGCWAVWLDKRADRAGYKIYSAQSADGRVWSDNLKVQDDFGDETPQWSVSVTDISPGGALVAWSDAREGNGQDIYYSVFQDGAWSDNYLLEHAAATHGQDSPALVSDANGGVHLIWRQQSDHGDSRIKYAYGRRTADH